MDVQLADPDEVRRVRQSSVRWPSHTLSFDQVAELELLMLGALSPLDGYLTDAQARSVHARGTLPDGRPCAAALQLRVPEALRAELRAGLRAELRAELRADVTPGILLGLRDAEGVLLAGLEVGGVGESGRVSGRVIGLDLPAHPDFGPLRTTPAQVQASLRARGWQQVAALVSAGPVLPSDLAAARLAVPDADGLVLITTSWPTHPHDESHFARARLHRAAVAGRDDVAQVLLPAPPVTDRIQPTGDAVRLAAATAAACGATALVADPGTPAPAGLGITLACLPDVGFDPGSQRWIEGAGLAFTHADLARALDSGAPTPPWAVPAGLSAQLRQDVPPRHLRGVTVLFTGLSGSGKSTIAGTFSALLKERGDRHVTFLDGDVVRTHLSKGLGFNRADRDTNVRRIGFVAAQVTSAGGIAICAPIAPYDATRRDVRHMVEATGGFVLVHVATPIEVCEARDRKGLYAKARQGLIPEFTGVSDPYEEPADAELTLDTTTMSAADAARRVLDYLERAGWLRSSRLPADTVGS